MTRFTLLIAVCAILVACGGNGDDATGDTSPHQVIDAFNAAGLEAESPRAMTRDDYGLAPFVGDGMRFFIPSLGSESGGRVIVVNNTDDRERLIEYYESLGRGSAALFSWVFTAGDVVVQINGSMPEDQARRYEAALNDAVD